MDWLETFLSVNRVWVAAGFGAFLGSCVVVLLHGLVSSVKQYPGRQNEISSVFSSVPMHGGREVTYCKLLPVLSPDV